MNHSPYRHDLPQSRGEVLLTDGGLETTLIFHNGLDLPEFAAFPLLDSVEGRRTLADYFRSYVQIALDQGVGVVLETPTWRASSAWGYALGYDAPSLHRLNSEAVALLRGLRAELETPATKIVVSGNIGPRGDGYVPGTQMTADEAAAYHRAQIHTFAEAGADMVSIITVNYAEEAIGATRAAVAEAMPIVVSFTVETDGRLPTGQSLEEAIGQVEADTGGAPVSYGINCAHPDHFSNVLADGGDWVGRIGLVRANASRMSHEELDNAQELDAGDAIELGQLYGELSRLLPGLSVMGGCCGTDETHITEIARACSGRLHVATA